MKNRRRADCDPSECLHVAPERAPVSNATIVANVLIGPDLCLDCLCGQAPSIRQLAEFLPVHRRAFSPPVTCRAGDGALSEFGQVVDQIEGKQRKAGKGILQTPLSGISCTAKFSRPTRARCPGRRHARNRVDPIDPVAKGHAAGSPHSCNPFCRATGPSRDLVVSEVGLDEAARSIKSVVRHPRRRPIRARQSIRPG